MQIILLLLPWALAASFTSTTVSTKLDFAQIKPKSDLIWELSQSECIPEEPLPVWIEYVLANEVHVSEGLARWVMFSARVHEKAESPFGRFFLYAVEKFGYASLVKDLVDYRGSDALLLSYLKKHKLDHFPHLPAPLTEAVAEMDERDLGYYAIYILPLLSDYSINHPAIHKIGSMGGKRGFKLVLISYCLGGLKIDLDTASLSALSDIHTIAEVANSFPFQMSQFIAGLDPSERDLLNFFQSTQPPSDEFWATRVKRMNALHDDLLAEPAYLTIFQFPHGEILHHLFQHQKEWIRGRIVDVKPAVRLAYFMSFPDDLLKLPHLPGSLRKNLENAFAVPRTLTVRNVKITRIETGNNKMAVGKESLRNVGEGLKTTLICYCLGIVEVESRLNRFNDLAIIDEVAREFPVQMSQWISFLDPHDRAFVQFYRSGQPPNSDFWNQNINHLHTSLDHHFWPCQAFRNLLPNLIHHLFQFHADWIRAHWCEIRPEAQTAYFQFYPSNVHVDLLPTNIPPFQSMITNFSTPHLVPFYRALAIKYDRMALKEAAINSMVSPNFTSVVIQCVRISDPQFLIVLKSKSVNHIFTAISYCVNGVRQDEGEWWFYLLLAMEPTTWVIPLLLKD